MYRNSGKITALLALFLLAGCDSPFGGLDTRDSSLGGTWTAETHNIRFTIEFSNTVECDQICQGTVSGNYLHNGETIPVQGTYSLSDDQGQVDTGEVVIVNFGRVFVPIGGRPSGLNLHALLKADGSLEGSAQPFAFPPLPPEFVLRLVRS